MQDDPNPFLRPPSQMDARQAEPYSNSLNPRPKGQAPKREKFIGFTCDEASMNRLHAALAGHIPNDNRVHLADFRQALAILAGMPTPEVVLVDLSSEEQPINALMDLSDTVDAGTVVLAVGDVQNVNFYRLVVKNMGIKEYIPKPLTQDAILKHFLPAIDNLAYEQVGLRGGRMIALCGARGGVGTSCIAVNLGAYIATELHRHTLLLDGEVNTGTLALDLNLPASRGLPAVLEAPQRVDQLLIERCVQDLGDRLHVMAGMEALAWEAPCSPEGLANFVQTIRERYNFMVADTGARLTPLARQLLFNAQQRVIVLDPTLISLRNVERLLTLTGGSGQAQHPLLVLNKAGAQGGLTQNFMEDKLGAKFDAVIPDLPRLVGGHSGFGTLAVRQRGPFRQSIIALAAALGIGTQPGMAQATAQPSYAGAL
ncbi:MAG: AAA family ATPase [Rhodospirillales bacterium]|nr:AAA family ATPase [Rhodospirillales bacterium]